MVLLLILVSRYIFDSVVIIANDLVTRKQLNAFFYYCSNTDFGRNSFQNKKISDCHYSNTAKVY